MIDLDAVVKDFVKPNGQWDMDKWRTFLPNRIVQEILKVVPPNGLGDDVCYWHKASDGNFTVKSAYTMIYYQQEHTPEPTWQRIWR